MLNKEKYAKELEDMVSGIIAVSKSGELGRCIYTVDCSNCIFHGHGCDGGAMDWLNSEYKETILTEEERKYLSAVIKQFRNKVCEIRKVKELYTLGHESILISVNNYDDFKDDIYLPRFEKGTMYKGMVTNKEYTLEELGL